MEQATNEILVPLLSTALINYLPGGASPMAALVAFQIGRAVGPALQRLAQLPLLQGMRQRVGWQRQSLLIEEDSALFEKMADYLFKHHLQCFRQCHLTPQRGDMAFQLKRALLAAPVTIEHEGDRVELSLSSTTEGQLTQHSLRLCSAAPLERLKSLVALLCKQDKEKSLLRIYHSVTEESQGKKKSQPSAAVRWREVQLVTNRSLSNTFLSASVDAELIADVRWFMQAQSWYAQRGLPYKRGYLLHGPPGTGKTSIAKALAVEHNLLIFTLDLSTVETNSQLVKLMTEIAYYACDERYLLLIEDADRCDLFQRHPRNDLTMDCFLNVLDGIQETHGRILLLSANDVTPLAAVPALMRPGRIDKLVEIGPMDSAQLQAMLDHFYPAHALPALPALQRQLTAAQVTNVLQAHADDAAGAVQALIGASAADPTINTTPAQRRVGRKPGTLAEKRRELRNVQRCIDRLQTELVREGKAVERKRGILQRKGERLQQQIGRLQRKKT